MARYENGIDEIDVGDTIISKDKKILGILITFGPSMNDQNNAEIIVAQTLLDGVWSRESILLERPFRDMTEVWQENSPRYENNSEAVITGDTFVNYEKGIVGTVVAVGEIDCQSSRKFDARLLVAKVVLVKGMSRDFSLVRRKVL